MTPKQTRPAKGAPPPLLRDLAGHITDITAKAAAGGFTITEVLAHALPSQMVVRRADYDAMAAALDAAEEAEDRRDAADAIAGRGDYLPAAMVKRLVAGENPIREWRRHRNMTAQALAGAAGIGKSFLSQIENGRKTPGVGTLKALAHALDCDLDDLV